jgi:hypothetical protein
MTHFQSFAEALLFGFGELITEPGQHLLAQRVGESIADNAKKVSQQTVGAVCGQGESTC